MSSDKPFAALLQSLSRRSGIKNSTIAAAVQYDVSYVSKWMNGRSLPAERNAEIVIRDLASTLVSSSSETTLAEFMAGYDCEDTASLEKALSNELREAYELQKGGEGGKTPDLQYHPTMRAVDFAKHMQAEDATHMAAVMDLLSMDHDARLAAAGIIDGRFTRTEPEHDVHYSLGLHIPGAKAGDAVYDSIFIVHMLTSYSGLDFCLYDLACSKGRCLYAARDVYSIAGSPFPDGGCVAVSEERDAAKVNALYSYLNSLMKQELLIFQKIEMAGLVSGQFYLQSLVSGNVRWLLGHVTEQLLPEGLFKEILSDAESAAADTDKDVYSKLHTLAGNTAADDGTRIMIYDSALAKLAATGELDFFNTRVVISENQRLEFFDYLYGLVETGEINLKIVYGGFSPDFSHVTNPCMFMSDTFCYLRLENDRYEDDLLVLQNQKVKDMFDRFFEIIWIDKPDIVEDEKAKILECIGRYRDSMSVLAVI